MSLYVPVLSSDLFFTSPRNRCLLGNYAKDQVYDRLGNNAEELEISGVTIPRIRIPVKTGRSYFGRD